MPVDSLQLKKDPDLGSKNSTNYTQLIDIKQFITYSQLSIKFDYLNKYYKFDCITRNIYYLIRTKTKFSRMFMSFEEFKSGLGSWAAPLATTLDSKLFQDIYKYVKTQYESGKKIYPPKDMIFNAFTTTPIQNVKVVIVGQDPYHQPNQAHGLCFSVMKPVPPPPSLKNIYKNLESDPNLSFKKPNHGDLTKWAQQGVFLLNTSLTVQDSKPNSHSLCGWQKFTDQVINVINKNCSGVVYLLWGKPAQTKAKSVNPTKNKILKTSHPSPLSASQGFLSCKHFSECNEYLKSIGKTPIDWNP